MPELSPLQKLNRVLELLASSNYDKNPASSSGLIKDLQLEKIKLNEKEILEILNKLHKDGYLHIYHHAAYQNIKNAHTAHQYIISFEGRIFSEQGGYIQQQENIRLKREKKDQNKEKIEADRLLTEKVGNATIKLSDATADLNKETKSIYDFQRITTGAIVFFSFCSLVVSIIGLFNQDNILTIVQPPPVLQIQTPIDTPHLKTKDTSSQDSSRKKHP